MSLGRREALGFGKSESSHNERRVAMKEVLLVFGLTLIIGSARRTPRKL